LDGSAAGPFVTVKDSELLDGTGQLTLSVWARRNAGGIGELIDKTVVYVLKLSATGISASLFNESLTRLDIIATHSG